MRWVGAITRLLPVSKVSPGWLTMLQSSLMLLSVADFSRSVRLTVTLSPTATRPW